MGEGEASYSTKDTAILCDSDNEPDLLESIIPDNSSSQETVFQG
jgi:ribosomal protein S2